MRELHPYVLINVNLNRRMSLNHDFLLLSRTECAPQDYLKLFRHPDAIHVHDDLLNYIADSLRWVPTLNPARDEHGFGLNFHGPTTIFADGAGLAAKIFRTWAQLFRLGPEHLSLTASWTEVVGKLNSGHFVRLHFERDLICSSFEKIAIFCDRVVTSNGAHFIAHLGI